MFGMCRSRGTVSLGFGKEIGMKKYVLAVDVGKGKSKIGLFGVNTQTMRVETILKPKDYAHSESELGCLLTRIGDLPVGDIGVMMESTYVYQSPLVVFFRRHGFTEISVINPLKIKKSCGDIQKVKTDKIDCRRIARFYFFSEWTVPIEISEEHREARELSRYIDSMLKEKASLTCRLRQHLCMVFPEIESIAEEKSPITSDGFLNLFESGMHPETLKKKTVPGIVTLMAGKGKRHQAYTDYAVKIKEAAKHSLYTAKEDGVEVTIIIPDIVRRLKGLIRKIGELEEKFASMTEKNDIFAVLESFDGIGRKLASHLTAEIWETVSYATPQKLIASIGINPSRSQSGETIDRYGKIVKAGNRYIRHWLFEAISSILRQRPRGHGDIRISDYYNKKHSDEKLHHYAATIACCNKLVRQLYYRSRDLTKTKELIIK